LSPPLHLPSQSSFLSRPFPSPQIPCIRKSMWYLCFWVWFVFCAIHFCANDIISFFFMVKWNTIVLYTTFFAPFLCWWVPRLIPQLVYCKQSVQGLFQLIFQILKWMTVHICMCACLYTHMHVYTCMHNTYIHTHMHTHTHTLPLSLSLSLSLSSPYFS
jgi:hypothetical protein